MALCRSPSASTGGETVGKGQRLWPRWVQVSCAGGASAKCGSRNGSNLKLGICFCFESRERGKWQRCCLDVIPLACVCEDWSCMQPAA